MRWQLHVTALNKLAHCGEAFRRRYIDRSTEPTKSVLMVGSAVDAAVTASLTQKMKTGALLDNGTVEAIARQHVKAGLYAGPVQFSDEEKARGLNLTVADMQNKAGRLAILHNREIAPQITPTAVQKSFSLNLDDYLHERGISLEADVVGTMDVIESFDDFDPKTDDMVQVDVIRDTKTAAKTPAHDVADDSDQLSWYAFGYWFETKKLPSALKLDYVIDLKTPKTATYSTTRTEDDCDVILRRLVAAARVIESGAFMPTKAEDPMCSPKYCAYHSTCPFVKRPKMIPLGGNQLVRSISTEPAAGVVSEE